MAYEPAKSLRTALCSAPAPERPAEVMWAMALIVSVSFLAITNRSFWLDECITAYIANQPTLADSWRSMLRLPEVQLPFFMLYMWFCTHVLHAEEWLLRAAALPWYWTGACIFIVSIGRLVGSTLVPAILIACSGFAWYYLNEARVYSIQLGFAFALIGSGAALLQTLSGERLNRTCWRLFLLALVLLCGTSVLGAMWGCFFCIGFFLLVPRDQWLNLFRLSPFAFALSACALATLAGYYGWTMTLHAKPAWGATTPQTVVFVFYELVGAAGLGPGRYDLRSVGIPALKPFLLPLGIFATSAIFIFWHGFKELVARCGIHRTWLIVAAFAVPLCLLCVLGLLTHLRVLGRHATPLAAFFILLMTYGIVRLSRLRGLAGKLIVGVFLLLSLSSCLSLRFASRHEKDNYRAAAAIVRSAAASGKNVWWNADRFGALYYHVVLERDLPGGGRVTLVLNQTRETLKALRKPDVVAASKPDIFDNGGALAAFLSVNDYRVTNRLSAFAIWAKDP